VGPVVGVGLEGVDEAEGPFVSEEGCFIVEGDAQFCGFVCGSEVGVPFALCNLKTNFIVLCSETSFALYAAVEVESVSVLIEDAVVDVEFVAIVFEAEVEGSVVDGEPEFELLVTFTDFAIATDGEGVLEGDGGGGGLSGKFEGEFLGDEVIVKYGVGASLKSGPGLGLEGVCFSHINKY
jgi:hypothetical protein